MDAYSELEYQRRHLVEQKTEADRAMVMAGIDRLLDQILDGAVLEFGPIASNLPNSVEGQAHIERGCE